ncbi:UDP-glucose:(heptosyl)LPS alpha-1,3-glucosyltransferase [Branchiibius hedensis]|uniref:UDP-glucose:(Heptosyl)LPS alpha-1,3-glucosyltransferase n=1 Tax=Branchiibius hedensis TaxID=672460 RepID=A0A2Y8ZSU2_9MICO|nr:glycosyltransferase family 4 protein [Branchiibius hedensis]PWJ26143.1 UDP-glucose:(heptosyl)LPS alpha-1,3-glucosyltransferase [Branchiibius hedensis]SSA34955.1 UDP-glucose:(heptosyl)LPS alpha-1,3-glucosyltransferase [Branchiibius hedensis]
MTTIRQLAPRIGEGTGVGAVAAGLAAAFQRAGVTVTEFTLADTSFRPLRAQRAGTRHLNHALEVIYFSTVGSYRARRVLSRHPQSWSICHNDLLAGDIYVNHGLLRLAMQSRGHATLRLLRNPLHVFTQTRDWWRFSYSRAHRAVVHLSSAEQTSFHRLYPRSRLRTAVIGNGVDTSFYRIPTAEERTRAREAFDLPPHAFVVGFAGHEFGRKGLRLLIEALPSLPPEVHLLVAGGRPEDIDDARRLSRSLGSADRVTLVGAQPDSRPTLWASDVLALPSSYESFSLILLEALSCGIPAIHTRVGAAMDLIEPGVNGFLIDRTVSDVVAAINAVRRLDPDAASRAARAAATPHDWDIVADRYLALLAELHAEPRADEPAAATG